MISPEDQKALDAIAAAQAAGQDPFGDDEPLSVKDDADKIEEPEGGAEEEADLHGLGGPLLDCGQ